MFAESAPLLCHSECIAKKKYISGENKAIHFFCLHKDIIQGYHASGKPGKSPEICNFFKTWKKSGNITFNLENLKNKKIFIKCTAQSSLKG